MNVQIVCNVLARLTVALLLGTGLAAPEQAAGFTMNLTGGLAPGHPQFAAASFQIDEAAGAASITVSRVGGSDGPLSIQFFTEDSTATEGSDYVATSQLISWNDGNATDKIVMVPILDDGTVEGDETVALLLEDPNDDKRGSAGNATLGSPNSATLIIADNDALAPTGQATPIPSLGLFGLVGASLLLLLAGCWQFFARRAETERR